VLPNKLQILDSVHKPMNHRERQLRDLHIVDDESAFEHADPSEMKKYDNHDVFTILLDHGKNTFTIHVGT
jgi:uncharacterized protein (DUF488 family)